MKRIGFWCLLITVSAQLLMGCAKIDGKARDYLSSSVEAFALVNGELLVGELALYLDRTGALDLRSQATPSTRQCTGQFRYTATAMAAIDLHCNDGAVVALTVVLLSETGGYGYGNGSPAEASASLTFGMVPAKALGYLRAPPGRQLVLLTKKPFLELK